MRTNVELDEELVTKAMAILGLTTKRATIEEALRLVVSRDAKKRALEELRGMGWYGDLDAVRGPHWDEPDIKLDETTGHEKKDEDSVA